MKPKLIAAAGGGKLTSTAVVPNCEFQLAKHTLQYNFRVLPLPGYDVILGYDWFTLMSPVVFNIPENTFSFSLQGKTTVTAAILTHQRKLKRCQLRK